MAETVCSECREPINEDATTCPHCGHDPSAGHARWAKIDALLAIICFGTVIGAPLGLWLVVKIGRHRKLRTATPAVSASGE